jgi:Mycoplasma protein of unknown function, DUF285
MEIRINVDAAAEDTIRTASGSMTDHPDLEELFPTTIHCWTEFTWWRISLYITSSMPGSILTAHYFRYDRNRRFFFFLLVNDDDDTAVVPTLVTARHPTLSTSSVDEIPIRRWQDDNEMTVVVVANPMSQSLMNWIVWNWNGSGTPIVQRKNGLNLMDTGSGGTAGGEKKKANQNNAADDDDDDPSTTMMDQDRLDAPVGDVRQWYRGPRWFILLHHCWGDEAASMTDPPLSDSIPSRADVGVITKCADCKGFNAIKIKIALFGIIIIIIIGSWCSPLLKKRKAKPVGIDSAAGCIGWYWFYLYMFDGCTAFNSNVLRWNMSRDTHFGGMFRACRSFHGDVSLWDVSAGT